MLSPIRVLKKIIGFFAKFVYWWHYISIGWILQLMLYLISRNIWIIHDAIYSLFSVIRRGNSFSRFIFMLKSRIIYPKSFCGALKSRNKVSRPLPADWESIRKSVLRRDDYSCTVCGVENIELHVDHIIPRKWHGNHGQTNLRTLCRHCHVCRHFRKF